MKSSEFIRIPAWNKLSHLDNIIDKMSLIESKLTESTLFETNDVEMIEYFKNLPSDSPLVGEKYNTVILYLVHNRLSQSKSEMVTLMEIGKTGNIVLLPNNTKTTYPNDYGSDIMLTQTFYFNSQKTYGQFVTLITLKFGLKLDQVGWNLNE